VLPLDAAAPLEAAGAAAQAAFDLAALDSQGARTLSAVLRPVLSLSSLLMIVRIVLSWYPEIDGSKMPWAAAVKPTGEQRREGIVARGYRLQAHVTRLYLARQCAWRGGCSSHPP
jgi:hypothetical protein